MRVAVRDVPAIAARHPIQVILAVVEDGLTSDVQRGENARRRLRHSAVARSLAIIGTLKPRVTSGEFTSPVTLERAWARDRLRLVAFVQDEKTLSIVGSGSFGREVLSRARDPRTALVPLR